MTSEPNKYTIFSIGDSAATIDFGNMVSVALNQKVVSIQQWLQKHPFTGLKDIIIGYTSLSVMYDAFLIKNEIKPEITVFNYIQQKLSEVIEQTALPQEPGKLLEMPVCYDLSLGYDLEFLSDHKKMSIEKIIDLHTSLTYRVYMIGFLPGFPYMGMTDEQLTVSRRDKPRQTVSAGSVGIAGNQTGIYPVESPGGWQIIGRTPMKLFDKNKDDAVLLKPGDHVKFHVISLKEFEYLSMAEY